MWLKDVKFESLFKSARMTIEMLFLLCAAFTVGFIALGSYKSVHGQFAPRMMAPRHDVTVDEVPEREPDELVNRQITETQESAGVARDHTNIELVLSFSVLGFGVLVLVGNFVVMLREQRYWDAMSLKVLAVVMSVTGAMFLITAGFSSTQIQPATNMLSALLGYAFGIQNSPGSTTQDTKPEVKPPAVKPA